MYSDTEENWRKVIGAELPKTFDNVRVYSTSVPSEFNLRKLACKEFVGLVITIGVPIEGYDGTYVITDGTTANTSWNLVKQFANVEQYTPVPETYEVEESIVIERTDEEAAANDEVIMFSPE